MLGRAVSFGLEVCLLQILWPRGVELGGLLAPPAQPWLVCGVQQRVPLKPQLLEVCD